MRIALLSDIHGNLPALEAVLADLRQRGCDMVANLGDCLSGPLWPLETAQLLMAENWPTVAGNHERQLLTLLPDEQNDSDRFTAACLDAATWRWLDALPATLSLANDLLLCHGSPASDTEALLESLDGPGWQPVLASEAQIRRRLGGVCAAVIGCGHTHIPRSLYLDGCCLVNPGSVGLQAYWDDYPRLYRMETGSPHARYAVLEQTAQGWCCQLVSVPYPHRHAADKARREGREDWALALQYGRAGDG